MRLGNLERKCWGALSVRAALRSLPLLAVLEQKGEILESSGQTVNAFWYWHKTTRSKHLLNILSAQLVSISFSAESPIGNAYAGYTSTHEVASVRASAFDAYAARNPHTEIAVRAATYASRASAYAVAASTSASFSAIADAASAVADADYAASFVSGAAAIKSAFEIDLRYLFDPVDPLTFLQKPIWPEGLPTDWQVYWVRFADWSISLNTGFEVWMDWYQERLDGKELDLNLLQKQVLIPAEIRGQGVVAVNGYLAALTRTSKAKAGLQPLNLVRAIFIGNGAAGKTSLIRALNGESVVAGCEEMTPGVDICDVTS